MTIDHHVAAILPCSDLGASQAFYERLGFALRKRSRPLSHLARRARLAYVHLQACHARLARSAALSTRSASISMSRMPDAVADRVRELVIEEGAPLRGGPGGCTSSRFSDPDGVLVRVGRRLG